jgi:hypothetical protein
VIVAGARAEQVSDRLDMDLGYDYLHSLEGGFPSEHRIWQMAEYRLPLERFDLSGMARLDQRFVEDVNGVVVRPRSAMRPPAGRSSIGLHPTPRWLLCRALVASTIDTAGEMRLDQPRGGRWSDTRSVRMNIDNAQQGERGEQYQLGRILGTDRLQNAR